jgi:leucyl-tRNA---protein transferase
LRVRSCALSKCELLDLAFLPACVPVARFEENRWWRRFLRRNDDIVANLVPAHATYEHFDLLKRYLGGRHPGGGMTEISAFGYAAMVEETTVRTHLVEYRLGDESGQLVGCALVDALDDGLSLVYSFYEPDLEERSLGSFIVLDHIRQGRVAGFSHIYLGYWIAGSAKMAYKVQFQPQEALGPTGWGDLDAMV